MLKLDLDTADKLSSVASGVVTVGTPLLGLFCWIFYRRRRSKAASVSDSTGPAPTAHPTNNTQVTQQDTSGFAAAGNQVISGTIHQSNTINQHSPELLEQNRLLLDRLEQQNHELKELLSRHHLTNDQLQMLTNVVLGRSTASERQAIDLAEIITEFQRLKQEANQPIEGGAPAVDVLLQQDIELFGQGKIEQSQDQLAQALQTARDSALPQKRQIAQVLVTQARQQLVLLNREAGAGLLMEAFNEMQHWADLEICSWLEEAGRALQTAGNTQAALAAYQQLLDTMQAKPSQQQDDGWLRAISVSHERIGDIHQVQGQLDAALDACQKALEIAERLASRDPTNAQWQLDVAISCERMAGLLASKDEANSAKVVAERRRYIQQGLDIARRLQRMNALPAHYNGIEFLENLERQLPEA